MKTTIALGLPHTPWVPERVQSFARLLGGLGIDGYSGDQAAFGNGHSAPCEHIRLSRTRSRTAYGPKSSGDGPSQQGQRTYFNCRMTR